MSDVIRHTPVETGWDFNQLSSRFKQRQESVGGTEYDNIVSFTFLAQPLINLMSDIHIGHPTTQYKRIEDEVNEIMSTANSYVVLMGDEIDNMHWNPGQFEQMEQTPEQIQYFMSIIRYFASDDRLLLRIPGDHDGWMMKQGFNLNALVREQGANTTTGPTHLLAKVKRHTYDLFLAHQLQGFSMYNRNHPQMRSERFGAGRGADLIASGHNHQKQISEGYTYEKKGESKPISYIALGSYKPTDGWLQKKGYPIQHANPEEMFGASILLDGRKHDVFISDDIVEANKAFKKLRQGRTGINRLTPLDRIGYDDKDVGQKWADFDYLGDENPTEDGR